MGASGDASEVAAFLLDHGLSVAHSPEKGRCVLASKPFPRGVEIFGQEPYVAMLDATNQGKRCDRCFRASSNLKRCSACKSVSYCCTDCQRNEWVCHKYECGALRKMFREKQRSPTSTLRLALRFLFKRRLQADKVLFRTAVDSYEVCEALPTHMSETDEECLVLYAQMAHLVQLMMAPDEVEIKEITEIICRFSCNAHTICDEEVRPVGIGLFPVISIINHSCSPNAVLHFNGKRAIVRALEDIKEGTEITISYVELAASTYTRRKALKEQYHFDCGCSRCCYLGSPEGYKEDAFLEGYRCIKPDCEGPLMAQPGNHEALTCEACGCKQDERELKNAVMQVETKSLEASQCYSAGNLDEAQRLYKEVEIAQLKLWHPYSIYLLRTRDNILKICMDVGDWTAALENCQRNMSAYARAYPPFSPLLGLQYYTLGKLEWLQENTTKAIDALQKAYQILLVTHGSGSSIVQTLASTLQEAHNEAAHMRMK